MPITAIGTVNDLLMKLFRIKYSRRRELFDEILKPVYKQFNDINKHYLEMLDEAERLLPLKRTERAGSIEWTLSDDGKKEILSDSQERERIATIITQARKSDKITAAIRELFRKQVTELFENIKYEEEKRFLFCVIAYFGSLIHEDINWSDIETPKVLTKTIERALSKRLTRDDFLKAVEYTSIGESLEDLLQETPEYEYPRKYVRAYRIWIDKTFVEIGVQYNRLHMKIIEKAPKI